MTVGEGGGRSTDWYRALLEHVSDFVAVVDASGSVTYVTPAVTQLVGYSPDAVVGEPLTDFVHEADEAAITELVDVTETGGGDEEQTTLRAEARVQTDEGEWVWLEFARREGTPAELDGVVVTARDITAQKRIIERFEHLVETASDLLVLLDENGVLTYATPAASRVLGYDEGELVGRNVLEYVHPDDRETVVEELHRGLAEPGYTATVEHRFKSKSGEWRWLESRGRSLSDAPTLDGNLVVVTRDVTQRHRRERQIAAQNERLDAFAAMVSHDLQNPLSVASGSLELYRQTGDESALERLDRAHQRMSELTSELLTLAREGNTVEDFERVSLLDCATAALETSSLPDERVTLSDSLPAVLADPGQVRTLFENLFGNVAEHGGPETRAWVDTLPDGEGFFVEDDGPGIDATDAETVFELGHSSKPSGTGLGLHIVATIVTAHEWDIVVTTGGAGGARFEIRGVEPLSEPDESV